MTKKHIIDQIWLYQIISFASWLLWIFWIWAQGLNKFHSVHQKKTFQHTFTLLIVLSFSKHFPMMSVRPTAEQEYRLYSQLASTSLYPFSAYAPSLTEGPSLCPPTRLSASSWSSSQPSCTSPTYWPAQSSRSQWTAATQPLAMALQSLFTTFLAKVNLAQPPLANYLSL